MGKKCSYAENIMSDIAFINGFAWTCQKDLSLPMTAKVLTDIPIVGIVASLVYLIIYTNSDSAQGKFHLKSTPIAILHPSTWGKGGSKELHDAVIARFAVGMIPILGRITLIGLDILATLMNSARDH